MSFFQNIDAETRIWPQLTNPKTGHTLELRPNEKVNLDLDPVKFFDPVLAPLFVAKNIKPLLQPAKADKEKE